MFQLPKWAQKHGFNFQVDDNENLSTIENGESKLHTFHSIFT